MTLEGVLRGCMCKSEGIKCGERGGGSFYKRGCPALTNDFLGPLKVTLSSWVGSFFLICYNDEIEA